MIVIFSEEHDVVEIDTSKIDKPSTYNAEVWPPIIFLTMHSLNTKMNSPSLQNICIFFPIAPQNSSLILTHLDKPISNKHYKYTLLLGGQHSNQ